MLVLSRKKNQSIVIDGGIEIQVLQLKGGTVKIGIKAPDDVRIVRGELEVYGDMIGAEASSVNSEGAADSSTDPDSALSELTDFEPCGLTGKVNEPGLRYYVEEYAEQSAGPVVAK